MDNINWANVEDEPERPEEGGYVVQILKVEDALEKKYLRISWDFINGPFKGANAATAATAGFWPCQIIRSYKPTALRFFKGFKTAVEESNRGFTFNNDPQSLVGKFIGVVLGEEGYKNKKGEMKDRLYVAETRSAHAIESGDFSVPAYKPYEAPKDAVANTFASVVPPSYQSYEQITGDDSELPF